MKHFLKRIPSGWARPTGNLVTAALLILTPLGLAFVPQVAAQTAEPMEEGAEVLTRGPVHEAFAGTISYEVSPATLVPQAPPAMVDEIPPDQRPEGDNVMWIPGYWAWDDGNSNFIWVSGIWRNLPPGRQWIPGYWSEAGQEYQWVSGYWADAESEEVEYLDAPPATLEAGPNIAAPSNNDIWIPGNWRWQDSRYAWQAGYWDEVRPDWTWVPTYYTSTPRGYVCVDGYYDYSVQRRGVIFAPVRFSGNRYARPDYRYRPTVVISLAAVLDHLFLRPRTHHYYFGDYYDEKYRRSGYYSPRKYHSGRHGYDPIFARQRWDHRNDRDWERGYDDNFAFYRDHREERPPHTLAALDNFFARPDKNRRVERGYATTLTQFAARKDSSLKFKKMDEAEEQKFVRSGRALREYSDQRRKSGGRDGSSDADRPNKDKRAPQDSQQGKVTRVKIVKSPVSSNEKDKRDRDNPPPERTKPSRSDKPTKDKADTDGPRGKGPQQNGPDSNSQPDKRDRDNSKRESKGDKEKDHGPKRDPRADSNRDPKAEPKREPKAEPKRDPRADSNRDPKAEPKREPKAEPKRDPRADSNRDPKAEPKREPKAEPKRDPRADSNRDPKAEPKREPKPEPKRDPRADSNRDPKAEPKRDPRADSNRDPKAEPKREPKAEPKRDPRADSNRDPKSEPKKEPKTEPKRQPKAEEPPGKKSDNPDDTKEKRKKGKG